MSEKNPILKVISAWFKRNFSDPGALGLFFTIILFFIVIEFFGKLLGPILASIVIAYLLDGVVRLFERWHLPHLFALLLAYCLFIAAILLILLGLMPILWRQLAGFLNELPNGINQSRNLLSTLSQQYPNLFGNLQIEHLLTFFKQDITKIGQWLLSFSISTIPNIISMVLYFVLIPLLVFFFLKDKTKIIRWCTRYLPGDQSLSKKVWSEVNHNIAKYIQGRVIEIVIVGGVSIAAFSILDLKYAFLIGSLVGLSVLIPYLGVILVTIPVLVVGLIEWGWSMEFVYLLITYLIIVALDGNLLAPLLFSEVMDLHPVAIILSVLIFGGIWGFWGIFFSIPLITLVKAVLYAWPREKQSISS